MRGRFCVRFGCTDDGSECLGLIDEIDIIRIEREKKEEEERLAAEAAAAAEEARLIAEEEKRLKEEAEGKNKKKGSAAGASAIQAAPFVLSDSLPQTLRNAYDLSYSCLSHRHVQGANVPIWSGLPPYPHRSFSLCT